LKISSANSRPNRQTN